MLQLHWNNTCSSVVILSLSLLLHNTCTELTDSDAITNALKAAGGDRESLKTGTLPRPVSSSSPSDATPLNPSEFHKVVINMDEYGTARAKSRSM